MTMTDITLVHHDAYKPKEPIWFFTLDKLEIFTFPKLYWKIYPSF